MKVIKELKGGSLSRTVVIDGGQRLLVRKYISITENREYGLVRWQSQIRKIQTLRSYLGESVISIESMGVDGSFYYYDMPFYKNALNCAELLENNNNVNLASEIVQLLDQMSKIGFGWVSGSVSVYLSDEVLYPLKNSLKQLLLVQSGSFSNINDMKREIESAIDLVLILIKKYENKKILEGLTHGNLTLENMLWDKDSKKLILIDPYSETYTESLCGDMSQISQSSLSGYEYIIKNKLHNDPSIDGYPYTSIPKEINLLGNDILDLVSEFDWFDSDLHQIMYASQFIRMFPFKIHSDTKQAYFFLMHGVRLLRGKDYA
jgi:virulence-associated protein VapD